MDTTTLSVQGVDDAELSRLLSDAGAPHDEVPRPLRRLRMYFYKRLGRDKGLGDTSILEGWGVSRGAIALIRAVPSAAGRRGSGTNGKELMIGRLSTVFVRLSVAASSTSAPRAAGAAVRHP